MHSNQHYSEEKWYADVLSHRDKAEKKGDLSTVARLDEILAKRIGIVQEAPPRQKVLDEVERKEAHILAAMRFHPRVVAVIDAVLAEGGSLPPQPAGREGITPNLKSEAPLSTRQRAVDNFGDEDFSGPEPRDSHARSNYL